MSDSLKLGQIVDAAKQGLHEKLRKLLVDQPMNDGELADALSCTPALVRKLIEELRARKVAISNAAGQRFVIYSFVQPGGHLVLKNPGRLKLGFTTDNHLCNKKSRLDVLNTAYDDFARRGVKDVFNAGNIIDGEFRLNRQELLVFGMQAQAEYFAEKFPFRPGITTHFITGDDHEGWYSQREQINIGEFMEQVALKAGRKDLHYIGHVESDVELKVGDKSCPIRVMHPGGGSAYAYSYTSQKIVESFQGGEKPSMVLGGHYHKWDDCYPREVHFIQGGCTCDQTIFMRKQKIAAHVGYVNLEVEQDKTDGHLTEVVAGWKPFYDRRFYDQRFD